MLKKNGTFLSGWLPLGHSIHKASTKRSNIRKYSTKQTKSPKFESIIRCTYIIEVDGAIVEHVSQDKSWVSD